jgi:hypothetical protein
MPLDIHNLKNGRPQEHLYSIDDETYALLSPALALFKRRTGLSIDLYGDTKFSSGLSALIKSIEISFPDPIATPISIAVLLTTLKAAESRGASVVFCGD